MRRLNTALFLSLATLCAVFVFSPSAVLSAPNLILESDGAKLYTYNTQCQSSALRPEQAFIIPHNVGTVENLFLHFHGSDNPNPQTLCTLTGSNYSLCAAATTLNNNKVRGAIILSQENLGNSSMNQTERECMLNEAKQNIASVAPLQNNAPIIVTASGAGGSRTALTYFEQGFVAKKTIIFGGCSSDTCEKISKFADSGQVLLYATTADVETVTATYKTNPKKIFVLSLPTVSDFSYATRLCYLDHVLLNKCNGTAKPILIPLVTEYGIGEKCNSNSDCKNDLDCEDSDIDESEDDFCVCANNLQCAMAYGDSNRPTETWECLDGTGIKEAHTLHYCQSNTNKVMYPLQSQEAATQVESDLITDLTRGFNQTPLTEAQLLALIQKPNPKIRIPGLTFSDLTINGKLSGDEEGNTYLDIPYLGEFMGAIYNYLILLAGLICVVRIIVGGALYAFPDTSGESKSNALKMIKNAIIGLLLAVGSYTILYLFNPELVKFKNLKIFYTRGEAYYEPAELPQSAEGGYVVGQAKVSQEAAATIGGLIGQANNLPACSAAAAQAAAKKLHDQKICVGPVHCAFTATRFLQYIGCSSKTLTGNANFMVGNLEQEGWVSLLITPENANNLPVGALWFPGHAGVSTGNGTMFESTIGGAFNHAADNKGCPNLSGSASAANCSYCAKLKGHEPWQKNIFYKNGTGKNQGWKTSGVGNIKQFRLVIYPAPASVTRPPLGCCKFSSGRQNLASRLFCEQAHIKKDGRGKIVSNDWNAGLWDANRNTTASCPAK